MLPYVRKGWIMKTIERVPPHDERAEQAVVGRCLVNADARSKVEALGLVPGDCYSDRHRVILEAIFNLAKAGRSVDTLTVHSYLKDHRLLDTAATFTESAWDYLTDLMMVMDYNVEAYAATVIENSRMRQAIGAHEQALADLFNPMVEDSVSKGQARVMAVRSGLDAGGAIDFATAAEETFGKLYAAATGPGVTQAGRAHTLGLPRLDEMCWIEPGETTVLGARPGHGKTALALQFVLNVVTRNEGYAHFDTLEMTKEALALRFYAMRTEAPSFRLRSGNLGAPEIAKLVEAYAEAQTLPFRLNAKSGRTARELIAGIRREKLRNPKLCLWVIDHLLKVKPDDPRASTHQQMTQISGDLTDACKELGLHGLFCYQLTKANDKEGRKPRASDLRESGSVEQDARRILLLHRPEQSGPYSEATLIIAKEHQGATGEVMLRFNGPRTLFEEVAG